MIHFMSVMPIGDSVDSTPAWELFGIDQSIQSRFGPRANHGCWRPVSRTVGRVNLSSGEYSTALSHLQFALNVYQKAVNPKEEAQTQAMMGQIYQRQGNNAQAMKFYQQSLATFVRLSDRLNEAVVYYALGKLELKNGNYDAAEKYLAQSISTTENIRRVSSSRDLTTAFSAAVHDRYQAYIECLMQKHQRQPELGLAVRALETSELARARGLAELLRATGTNLAPGVDSQLATQERSLRQLRMKESARVDMLGRAHQKEELHALDAEVTRLESQYNQVRENIKARYPAYEQIARPVNLTLQQIQEQVVADDQTLLLEYSLGVEKSYVWAVTRDQINELPSQTAINESVQNVYGLLSESESDSAETEHNLSEATQALARMVLAPVTSHLNKQRLIVVADGALNYIPFQVLPLPSGSEPLVATHEVINVPSASILGQLRLETERRGRPTEVLAAFGDPVFASNYAQNIGTATNEQIAMVHNTEVRWQHALRDIETVGDKIDLAAIQPLFFSKLELANLREVAGPKSFVATGSTLRVKAEQADLTKYCVLHFATHGILDPKRPENSGLFLSMVDRNGRAQNGFIDLHDIYRLHAPVDLVVLSACRTGLGKDVRGEGLIGLTRGFMYAGASSVMASLWKVDDEATAELMKRFYANVLQNHMKPAAALRAAQNSIRQEPQWRAPHFWAAFTLQGEYNKAIELPSRRWLSRPIVVTIVASLLSLFVIGVWWYRRAE